MPLWINALGIGSIGIVYGYVLIYGLKRCLPPVSNRSPSLKELVLLMTSLGVGGVIGASVTRMDGVNYIGPYGLGLLVGMVANVAVTLGVGLWAWRFGAYGEGRESSTDQYTER